jgi:hypothetical protein
MHAALTRSAKDLVHKRFETSYAIGKMGLDHAGISADVAGCPTIFKCL